MAMSCGGSVYFGQLAELKPLKLRGSPAISLAGRRFWKKRYRDTLP